MKKRSIKKRGTRLLALVLSGILSLGVIGNANLGVKSVEAAGEIAINKTNFEDDNFRKIVLERFDLDGNKSLSASEISKIEKLELYGGSGMSSLKGIEHFTSLEKLRLENYADIKSIDISRNTALKWIEIYGCGLTSLDVSKNTELRDLNIPSNKITSLTLGDNPKLEYLDCSSNAIHTLDVSTTKRLNSLFCQNNPLQSLLLGETYELDELNCSNGNLSSLDVSRHSYLHKLDCTRNYLKVLSLSSQSWMFENPLSYIDVKVGNQKNSGNITVYVEKSNHEKAKEILLSDSVAAKGIMIHPITLSIVKNLNYTSSVLYGDTYTFSVLAEGEGLTYQWYWRKASGGEWTKYGTAGPDKTEISIVGITERSGFRYYCEITDKYGNWIQSNDSVLHVYSPYFVYRSADVTKKEGSGNAVFRILAEGPAPITYQWYWRKNADSEWQKYGTAGTTKTSISVEAIKARNGFQYKCMATDGKGNSLTSYYVTLTVVDAISITKQPQSVTVPEGTKHPFTVEATGDGLTYQWYWRKNASSEWGVCGFTGAKTASMTVDAISARNGYRYRCEITDKYGNKKTSNEAVLKLAKPLAITSQPKNVTVKGGVAAFTVGATGEGLTYQWQWRKNASSAWGISDFKGCKTSTLYVEAISARNGFQYRCMIKDSFGRVVYSNPATLTYGETAKITKQPLNVACTEGVKVTFSVQASGDGLTYLWYWRKNETSDWGVCGFTGAQSSSMVVEAIAARNGYQYRCRIKDKYGNVVYTDAVTLRINLRAIKITTQPVSKSAANGSGSVKFSIAATGENLTYQWYLGLPNSDLWFEYGNEGTTNTSISVDATNENNGYQYRCRVRDGHGNTLYSNIATLTVTK